MIRFATMRTLALPLALCGLLAACDSGPSTDVFVQACLQTQGTKPVCECVAKEAKSTLSSKLFTAMVLDMQGKKQEAEAITKDMTFEERAAFAQKQFAMLGKCMPNE